MNLGKEIFELELKDIMPNRFQPREVFDDEALNELSTSIKEHGVIQPIVVRKVGDKYEIIAGERRYRASLLAGKETIPAIVSPMDDREAAKVALIENLQRKDLSAIEEARTYQTILKLDNMTQEELAQNLGKSQSAIANKLRLLNLDDEVQTALLNGEISERHARSLLNLQDRQAQKEMLNKIIENRLTVRQLDEEIEKLIGHVPENDETSEITLPTENENINASSYTNNEIVQPVLDLNGTGIVDTSINDNNIEPEVKNEQERFNFNQTQEENIMPNQELNLNTIDNTKVENEVPNIENIKDVIAPDIPTQDMNITFNFPEETKQQINSYTNALNTIEEDNKQNANNVFDKFRIQDSNIESAPDLPVNEEPIKYDMRFAINNFRQAVQNTEKFGFKVEVVEADLENSHQIIINILKK